MAKDVIERAWGAGSFMHLELTIGYNIRQFLALFTYKMEQVMLIFTYKMEQI